MSTNIPRQLSDDPIADLPHPQDTEDRRSASEDSVRPLMALHQRIVDALKGYAKMVEKAEPEFRQTAEKFYALHDRHATALTGILRELGQTVTQEASMMGHLNQAVVAFRSFVDAIDSDVLAQIRDGEGWILEAFDEAIAGRADPIGGKLRGMRAELDALLAETAHLG